MTTTPVIRVSKASTRAELQTAITETLKKAQRYSWHDQRRLDLNDSCNELIDWWVEAKS